MSPITMDILSVQEKQLQPQEIYLQSRRRGYDASFYGMSQQGNWWNTKHKSNCMVNAGIGSIWLPPVSKARSLSLWDMTLRITLILEIITKMELQKLVSVLKLN
jgi:hypothetical protein